MAAVHPDATRTLPLDVRRAALQATYTAMEVGLSGLQSQSSWLAGQLSSLAASS